MSPNVVDKGKTVGVEENIIFHFGGIKHARKKRI